MTPIRSPIPLPGPILLAAALLLAAPPGAAPALGQDAPPPLPPAELPDDPPAPVPPPAEAPSPAEQPAQRPAAEFGEELEVSEVFLDVVAVDRRGRPVPGLGAEDFVVREEGEPVEITSVTYYTTRYDELGEGASEQPPREGGQTAPAEVPAARYFILFFHDQTGTVDNQAQLARRRLQSARYARQWVEREMQPSDWIAVVRFDTNLTVVSDFTQNRDAITEAIETAMVDERSDLMRPSVRRRAASAGGPSLLRGLPNSFRIDSAATRPYDAVRLVAEASGHIVGRKNLILFSLGFGQLGSAFRTGDSRYYPPMEEALNANNVAVYPIDLAGPRFDSAQTAFLSQLADDTGGELFKTFHSFAEPFRRISAQNTGYYLVTFRTEHPAGESGYREVEVEAKPKGVRVRARKGYRYGEG